MVFKRYMAGGSPEPPQQPWLEALSGKMTPTIIPICDGTRYRAKVFAYPQRAAASQQRDLVDLAVPH